MNETFEQLFRGGLIFPLHGECVKAVNAERADKVEEFTKLVPNQRKVTRGRVDASEMTLFVTSESGKVEVLWLLTKVPALADIESAVYSAYKFYSDKFNEGVEIFAAGRVRCWDRYRDRFDGKSSMPTKTYYSTLVWSNLNKNGGTQNGK